VALLWVAVCVALVAGACTGRPALESEEEHERPATGPPLIFGMYNQEEPVGGTFADLRIAADVAVQVVNGDLGGIVGRPIRIELCATDGTARSAVACAQRLIARKPLAILGGVDLAAAAALPVYENAGLAVIGGVPIPPDELAAPNAFRFSGFASSSFPALAVYAADALKARSVAIVRRKDREARSVAERYLRPALTASRVASIRDVTVGDGETAWTQAMAAAAAGRVDAVFAVTGVGRDDDCIAAIRARRAVRLDAPLLMSDLCATDVVEGSTPAAMDGVVFATSFFLRGKEEREYVLELKEYPVTESLRGPFANKLKQYAYDLIGTPTAFSRTGYAEVMNTWELLDRAGAAALTPAGVMRAFRETERRHNLMAYPYGCAGPRPFGLSSVCNTSMRIVRFHDRRLEEVTDAWIDGARLLPGATRPSAPVMGDA
jgi:branched-chain amino acid transport system substrate-binding protein